MSSTSGNLDRVLYGVRMASQAAQVTSCLVETCASGKGGPFCAAVAGVEMFAQAVVGSGDASVMCPNVSRTLAKVAGVVEQAAQARNRFLQVAEPAAEISAWEGLALDKASEVE